MPEILIDTEVLMNSASWVRNTGAELQSVMAKINSLVDDLVSG